MSHASLFIIVPQDIFLKGEEVVESFIEDKMQYYDENLSVPSYKQKCWCVGKIADIEAEKQLKNEMGSWNKARSDFHENHIDKNDKE